MTDGARTSTPCPIRVLLLDGFELQHGGEPVLLPASAQRLIAFLALHERSLQRPFVSAVLWPDTSDERAAASLRSTLWRIRRSGCPVVETTTDHLRLARGVTVDVHEATAAARRVLTGCPDIDELDPLALSREILLDWSDDWVLLWQERFRQLRLHALERISERLADAGRFGEATEAAVTAVAGEPLRESAHRVLIKAYLAEGNRGAAIRQYEAFHKLLANELGASPSQLLEELIVGL
jgi:DNA-binding SARP family transcriptional activator